jgi:hypothetical protein
MLCFLLFPSVPGFYHYSGSHVFCVVHRHLGSHQTFGFCVKSGSRRFDGFRPTLGSLINIGFHIFLGSRSFCGFHLGFDSRNSFGVLYFFGSHQRDWGAARLRLAYTSRVSLLLWLALIDLGF